MIIIITHNEGVPEKIKVFKNKSGAERWLKGWVRESLGYPSRSQIRSLTGRKLSRIAKKFGIPIRGRTEGQIRRDLDRGPDIYELDYKWGPGDSLCMMMIEVNPDAVRGRTKVLIP